MAALPRGTLKRLSVYRNARLSRAIVRDLPHLVLWVLIGARNEATHTEGGFFEATFFFMLHRKRCPPDSANMLGVCCPTDLSNILGGWCRRTRSNPLGEVAPFRPSCTLGGFRFANVTSFSDPDFLPGGAKYLDLPGMIALAAPGELWLAGERDQAPPVIGAAYKASGRPDRLTISSNGNAEAAVKWLLR